MNKEDIVLEIKKILTDADGYDIDPYILELLLTKISTSEREPKHMGEVMSDIAERYNKQTKNRDE